MVGKSKKKSPLRRSEKAVAKRQGPTGGRFGLLSPIAQLIDLLGLFEGPADAVISRFFRDHPELGARERPLVAEAVYCWLRYRYRINHLAQSGEGGSAVLRQAKLALLWSGAPEYIWSAGRVEDNEWLSRVINVSAENMALEPRTCLPQWLYQQIANESGVEQAELFAQVVLAAAPLDLRVNTLKASVQVVYETLLQQGIQTLPIAGLSEGLRAVGKPVVGRTELFQAGAFEVQDAGSQWVSKLVAPRRGDLVVDFCAGAGGKTLAVAAAMKNTGRVVALDTSALRLQKFKPRAARAGMSNFYTLVIDGEADPRLNTYFAKADRVILDVPCTGTGTLRRNPDLKFRQNEKSVQELVAKQRSILEHASRLVKADGRLIYMTCSVFRQENEEVVEWFLANHPEFRLRKWTEVLNPADRPQGANTDEAMFRLWPSAEESDGFFAAVLQKAKT